MLINILILYTHVFVCLCVCGEIRICILTIHRGSMVCYPHCISVIIAGAGTNGGETGRLPKDGQSNRNHTLARCEKINGENMREPRLTAALPPSSPGG